MAIDLEGIMNRIMNMVEKRQKYMPSGMQVYNDAQTQLRNDAIDKVSIARDQSASNERTALLAHPASSLDFRGREAYANAAIGKMNAEAQHNLGMAAQGYGVSNQYNQSAEAEKAKALGLRGLTNVQRTNIAMGRPAEEDNPIGYSNETIDKIRENQKNTLSLNYPAPQMSPTSPINNLATPGTVNSMGSNNSISNIPYFNFYGKTKRESVQF